MDKEKLVIFSLIFYTLYKTKCIEKTSNTDNPLSTENLAAIRNLGNFAKTLQSGNDITIPGNLNVDGNIFSKQDIKGKTITVDKDTNYAYTFKTKGVNLTINYRGTTNERLVLDYFKGLNIKGGVKASPVYDDNELLVGHGGFESEFTKDNKTRKFRLAMDTLGNSVMLQQTDENFQIAHYGDYTWNQLAQSINNNTWTNKPDKKLHV